MTKHSHGSSLLQARDQHSFSHSNSQSFHRLHHAHSQAHTHARNAEHIRHHDHSSSTSDNRRSDSRHVLHRESSHDVLNANHESALEAAGESLNSSNGPNDFESIDSRDAPESPTVDLAVRAGNGKPQTLVTHVVQTVSLVQVVDPHGSPIETKTRYASPNTVVVDPKSGKTVAISSPKPSKHPVAGSSGDAPGSSSTIVQSTAYHVSTSLTRFHAPLGTGPRTDSQSSPLTSAPSVMPSAKPTAGVAFNETTSARNGNSSSFRSSNSSIFRQMAFSTPVSLSDSLSPSSTLSETKSWGDLSSTSITTSNKLPSPTSEIVFDGAAPTPASPTSSSKSEGSPGDLSVQQKQIIGGVVGSIAGVSIVMLLLLLALKYKKKRDNRSVAGHPQLGTSENGSQGAYESDTMAERSTLAVASSVPFAGLMGKRPAPQSREPVGNERGFYRVSGRKLPSVLTEGGDGYSDPRESVTSGTSDYYRGSQAFDPATDGAGGSARLALGTPMRPVSGVPIMRSGPARIPVTETNPFADQHDPFEDPPTPPTPPRDPGGRLLGSRGSPRGSTSRFQESI